MYKAIIFDFFGVIQADPYQRWLSKNSFKREGAFDEASRMVDRNLITMQQFFATLQELSGEPVEKIQDAFYENKFIDETLVKFIKTLKNTYKIGLLSNSRGDYLRPILATHQLTDLFDEIIISSEVGIIKPDKEIFELTLRKMDLSAEQAIFIDDNQTNTEAASAAGIKSIYYKDLATLKETLTRADVNFD